MTRLIWDTVGTRIYQTGVDRGVLYFEDGNGIPWNGLTSVEEDSEDSVQPLHFDGVKYLDVPSISEFSGVIKAFTYPDEILEFEGVEFLGDGLFIDAQAPKQFNLSYRTRIANDIDGVDYGYKIHILFNVTATLDDRAYETISSETNPMEFSWRISAVPDHIPGYKPTAHVVIDTTEINEFLLEHLEGILYGTDFDSGPNLPSLPEFVDMVANWPLIDIVDNGDGTWTATAPDEFITMLDDTTFQITGVEGEYIDAVTYRISNTYP